MSSFKDVNASGNIDYHTLTKDNLAYPRVIWSSSGMYMGANHRIPIQMSLYPTGIQFFWSKYNQSAGTAANYEFNVFTYIKNSYESEGRGIIMPLFSRINNKTGLKYIYVNEDRIVGHSMNESDEEVHSFFGQLYNKDWVLTKIVAF